MTGEKAAINRLCERISEEQDPVEFQRLMVELLDLLEQVAPEKETIPDQT
jgi:hypothetical protein